MEDALLTAYRILTRLQGDFGNKKYYEDCLVILSELAKEDKERALSIAKELHGWQEKAYSAGLNTLDMIEVDREIRNFEAHYSFDDFLIALECKRPIEKRFYVPRRKQLISVVNDLQSLHDGKLNELFISMPPRVGKTTLVQLFALWEAGLDSEKSTLYCSYSDTITSSFYNGLMEILTDNYSYAWHDIFPKAKFDKDKNGYTNAKDETIDIDHPYKRYKTITCRSLYGTLNGSCDCDGTLIADDLVSGLEESLNKDLLAKIWQITMNDLLARCKQGAKILWIGTRWSLADPIGMRLSILDDPNNKIPKGWKWKVINVPALNDEGKSNFDYLFKVGFDTDNYLMKRMSFESTGDEASWLAQYMGQPIERSGLVFPPESLNYYNGVLPRGTPDRIFAYSDIGWGGVNSMDYTSMPIGIQFGDEVYIADWMFDNGAKDITRPMMAGYIKTMNVGALEVEKNNGGGEYAEDIEEYLKKMGIKINIKSEFANTQMSKQDRILAYAPDIRKFYFLDASSRRGKPSYQKAMENLFSYTMNGKNKHDDAPDSLAGLGKMLGKHTKKPVEVFKRPF